MINYCFALYICSLFLFSHCCAEKVVWEGKVESNGTPSQKIKLILGEKYQIEVGGLINLGKWWKSGQPLIQDASYEFNAQAAPSHLISFKNSLNIPVGDGKYHPNHIYFSEPFIAVQSGIHFWIYDTNYEDNSGHLDVKVILLNGDP